MKEVHGHLCLFAIYKVIFNLLLLRPFKDSTLAICIMLANGNYTQVICFLESQYLLQYYQQSVLYNWTSQASLTVKKQV